MWLIAPNTRLSNSTAEYKGGHRPAMIGAASFFFFSLAFLVIAFLLLPWARFLSAISSPQCRSWSWPPLYMLLDAFFAISTPAVALVKKIGQIWPAPAKRGRSCSWMPQEASAHLCLSYPSPSWRAFEICMYGRFRRTALRTGEHKVIGAPDLMAGKGLRRGQVEIDHSSSSQRRITSSFWSRSRASQGSMSRWRANCIAALACLASFRDTSFLPGNAGFQDVAARAIDSFSSIMFSSIFLLCLSLPGYQPMQFEGRGVGTGKWMNPFELHLLSSARGV